MKENTIHAGRKVHYVDDQGNKQDGVIKSRHPTNKSVFFVVYDCGKDWANYKNYTGVYTHINNLMPDWCNGESGIVKKTDTTVSKWMEYLNTPSDPYSYNPASKYHLEQDEHDRIMEMIRTVFKEKKRMHDEAKRKDIHY